MAAWSSLASRNIIKYNSAIKAYSSLRNELKPGHNINNVLNYTLVRGHNTMTIVPSRFSWNKFKDMTNFYFLLGIIPILLVSGYCHIFIGPATLAVIPEGYEPKQWEYHKNPITRFFAKYVTVSPQEAHERNLHNAFYQQERYMIRQLERKIEQLMKERLDYQAYYMSPRSAKYWRQIHDIVEENEKTSIQSRGWVK